MTERHCSLKRGPKTNERAERERKEESIGGSEREATVDFSPGRKPPVPALASVEPPQRSTARPGSTVNAQIAPERERQVGSKRGMAFLIVLEFCLRRERQAPENFVQTHSRARAKALDGAPEFFSIELVGSRKTLQKAAQCFSLAYFEEFTVGVGRFNIAQRKVHQRSIDGSGPVHHQK